MAFILINKSHFLHNLTTLSHHLGGKEKIAIVLKDNAYGHDLKIMATLAREFGITRAYVRTLQEADAIWPLFRQVGVLGETPEMLPPATIHIVINALEQIKRLPVSCGVELKVDTGMHRNGIAPEELEQALSLIKERRLVLSGVFTHMRSGDDLGSELFWQQKNFAAIRAQSDALCTRLSLKKPLYHSCSSSAALRHRVLPDDYARIGISAYGYCEMDSLFDPPSLQPVLSLWGERLTSRALREGARVGYSGSSEVEEDSVVSSYDLGYADGLLRLNESHTYTTPGGYRLLPRVSMDYVSVTGSQNPLCLFADARPWAKLAGTITYDVLAKLHPKIPRKVV